jgi:hypothetical protein
MIRIRFRYDKGGRTNFSERTFNCVTSLDESLAFLCPVATSLRVLLRWSLICRDPTAPVFCFKPTPNSKRRFLMDSRVTTALRTAVISLYPDPSHIYRINIKDVRTHSVRVYACLVLHQAGFQDFEIEYKLRWCSKAWMVYIRENLANIPSQTLAVFFAAFVADKPSSDPSVSPLPLIEELDANEDDGN